MIDKPRTDQEQWAADLFRLLGFDVKMNYWPRETPRSMEIDVWGRLGPLQIAVECKKYSRDTVGGSDIEYFYEKLQALGPAVGIFVANSYSDSDLALCHRFGILPLTSKIVLDGIARIERDTATKKHLAISIRTWDVLGALLRFAQDWKGYLDPSWPFHRRIYATEAFETHGLIETDSSGFGDFEYRHTEAGKVFFGHIKDLLDVLEGERVVAMSRLDTAADLLIEICRDNLDVSACQGFDRVMVQGLGLQDASGQPTAFGRQMALIVEEAVLRPDISPVNQDGQ